jgi:DNA-binding MarR family transcriptional regulator
VGRGAPARSSPPQVRLYPIDYITLTLLANDGYGYSTSLARRLQRTQRTLQRHLQKLEHLNLVERHGRPRCRFQWWSVNETAKRSIRALCSYFKARIGEHAPARDVYLTFNLLPVYDPSTRPPVVLQHDLSTWKVTAPRIRREPDRPSGRSIPFIPFCKRCQACPFPVCVRGLSWTDKVGRAILERAAEWVKALSYTPA